MLGEIKHNVNDNFIQSYSWVWPEVGATPIYQGLDSEMFDRTDYPYSETFVREAIQNSLDARLDMTRPVQMRFGFHEEETGPRYALLLDVMSFREQAGLEIPREWPNGRISWLIVEDFNSKGLRGSLEDRTSDFWNYWLNFGLSNKEGEGRGGRGFGRVTFLIASRIQSVIGYTRRVDDEITAVCGMSVLRAQKKDHGLKSTDAYLAECTNGNIYDLHSSPEFHRYVRDSLSFTGYDGQYKSGFGLAILYPYSDLSPKRIFAAAIENFTPAIMDETLELTVDQVTLNAESIRDIAHEVEDHLKDEAIRSNVDRFLDLVRQAQNKTPQYVVKLPHARVSDLKDLQSESDLLALQAKVVDDHDVVLEIEFPLNRSGSTTEVAIQAAIGSSLSRQKPIDRMFREGMSLPEVRARRPSELDLIMLVNRGQLATYLNFCEGKAHLDLLESKEVLQTLKAHGFDDPKVERVKRLVKRLPDELRILLTPDVASPDSHVFDLYFSKPVDARERDKEGGKKVKPIGPFPPARPPVFDVETLNDGLRMCANPNFPDWPMNVTVTLAYADGTRRPSWSPLDFTRDDLSIYSTNCDLSVSDNQLRALNCDKDTEIKVTGFDTNRELDTTIRPWRNA